MSDGGSSLKLGHCFFLLYLPHVKKIDRIIIIVEISNVIFSLKKKTVQT